MSIQEQLDQLTGMVASLAASVVHRDDQIEAHDRQIDGLIKIAEKQAEEMKQLKDRMDQLSRDWQAYLISIRPH